MSRLDQRFAHPRDASVRFVEETHTYYILSPEGEWSPADLSVTGVVHGKDGRGGYFEHFDAERVARGIARRIAADPENVAEKDRRYVGLSAEEIAATWAAAGKEASALGTAMHAAIEDFYNGEMDLFPAPAPDDGALAPDGGVNGGANDGAPAPANGVECAPRKQPPDTKEFAFFRRFHQERVVARGWVPFRTEFSVWDAERRVCGQIDMLYVIRAAPKGDGVHLHIALYDWKRAKEMKTKGFRRGTGPCAAVEDCNYGHYSLQLNLYKWFLETHYGEGFVYESKPVRSISVDEMCLVVLHPNNEDYELYPVHDMGSTVEAIMDELLTAQKRARTH